MNVTKTERFLLTLTAWQMEQVLPGFTEGDAAELQDVFYQSDELQAEESGVLALDDGTVPDLSVGWTDGIWQQAVRIVSANDYNRLWIGVLYEDRYGVTTRIAVVYPEITVTGDTDFGNVAVVGGFKTEVYTVKNDGIGNLYMNTTPRVTIIGANAGNFTVTIQPADTVLPGDTTQFSVRFNPSAAGQRNASIRIVNNDIDENPFFLPITGRGIEPDITVTGDTDFGTVGLLGGYVDQTYTITNDGGLDLELDGTPKVAIAGADAADFTVTLQPTSPVAPAGTTTFTIRFEPTTNGNKVATASIDNNDPDDNPYVLNLTGLGLITCPYAPWPGVAPNIAIQGYADGMLTACPVCLNSALPAWAGNFTPGVAGCQWIGGSAAWSISGKRMTTSYVSLAAGVWTLEVHCIDGGVQDIWAGIKTTGLTPLGVYTRTSGCDATANLTIV